MSKIISKIPDNVHQGLRLAMVYEREAQYQVVVRALTEFLTKRGYLDAEGKPATPEGIAAIAVVPEEVKPRGGKSGVVLTDSMMDDMLEDL